MRRILKSIKLKDTNSATTFNSTKNFTSDKIFPEGGAKITLKQLVIKSNADELNFNFKNSRGISDTLELINLEEYLNVSLNEIDLEYSSASSLTYGFTLTSELPKLHWVNVFLVFEVN